MKEISLERRDELRKVLDRMESPSFLTTDNEGPLNFFDFGELRTLLDYADERDEAVALLKEARFLVLHGECPPELKQDDSINRIDALLRRVGGET